MLRPFYKLLFTMLHSPNSFVSFLGNLFSKFGVNFVDSLLSFAMTSYLDSVSQEEFPNFGTANTKFLMKSKFRDSSVIFADEIVNIDVAHFEGNVYNLETAGHWYSASSIIAHNCLCITETKLLPRGKKVKTTTIESQTKQEPDLITVDSVETASRTVTLKD